MEKYELIILFTDKTLAVKAMDLMVESYDHYVYVTRIYPTMLDGQELVGQHYLPTKAEVNKQRWQK